MIRRTPIIFPFSQNRRVDHLGVADTNDNFSDEVLTKHSFLNSHVVWMFYIHGTWSKAITSSQVYYVEMYQKSQWAEVTAVRYAFTEELLLCILSPQILPVVSKESLQRTVCMGTTYCTGQMRLCIPLINKGKNKAD